MKIVIIGSGNVAYHLCKAFGQNHIPITQIFGRNEKDLKQISAEHDIPFSTTSLAEADLYLVCVSDDSISEISKLIKNENSLVAHTSGSLEKEVLAGNYRKASFYPLQTFSRAKMLNYSEIPFFIEAEKKEDEDLLFNLAEKISKKVMLSTYEKRKYIHLTAVFSCNFVNHLFARAKEISDREEIPFDYFLPLIKETTEKIAHIEPKFAQTGPAVRNDHRVLKLHEALLPSEEHRKIYQTLNESIKKMYEL
ncbi:Rossmann-like and DUF2520 domain-containing protein [Kaistella daneshvariae]|jgi:predicted short-subunit dehydrogenase-like oxidoreductase (DUF2520 family)|uniref:Rossmann-like and DUF2520 domain-containing protein n=1 Tax=Kaistella daneshvariae TaxID=2487074 RepID=UPI0039EBC937